MSGIFLIVLAESLLLFFVVCKRFHDKTLLTLNVFLRV